MRAERAPAPRLAQGLERPSPARAWLPLVPTTLVGYTRPVTTGTGPFFDAMAASYDDLEPWYEHLYDTLHGLLRAELAPKPGARRGFFQRLTARSVTDNQQPPSPAGGWLKPDRFNQMVKALFLAETTDETKHEFLV